MNCLTRSTCHCSTPSRAGHPVYLGGPVQTDRGFVLHQPLDNWNATLAINDDTGLTTSRDVLVAVSQGDGPYRMLITLGYAGWGAGQLEQELAQNAWLTVPANLDCIYGQPPEARFAAAMQLLGFDPLALSWRSRPCLTPPPCRVEPCWASTLARRALAWRWAIPKWRLPTRWKPLPATAMTSALPELPR